MSTKETVRHYFDELARRGGWQALIAEDFAFTSYTSPVKAVPGKAAFLDATKRFYASIISFELRDILVDGSKACALTRYELRSPTGATFHSDVAELFTVTGDQIAALGIYFDTAPFPK